MIGSATKDALRDVAPPAVISAATLLGMRLEDWVLYLTLTYAAVRLLMLIPKAIGCSRCFYQHRTCPMSCKTHIDE